MITELNGNEIELKVMDLNEKGKYKVIKRTKCYTFQNSQYATKPKFTKGKCGKTLEKNRENPWFK
jgi:predicted RNA-binding protein with RPS1 domain